MRDDKKPEGVVRETLGACIATVLRRGTLTDSRAVTKPRCRPQGPKNDAPFVCSIAPQIIESETCSKSSELMSTEAMPRVGEVVTIPGETAIVDQPS
jgi:hypothetical protein